MWKLKCIDQSEKFQFQWAELTYRAYLGLYSALKNVLFTVCCVARLHKLKPIPKPVAVAHYSSDCYEDVVEALHFDRLPYFVEQFGKHRERADLNEHTHRIGATGQFCKDHCLSELIGKYLRLKKTQIEKKNKKINRIILYLLNCWVRGLKTWVLNISAG